ncbi:Cell division topological specificity factor [invertebrate metagenome]|uniref:Cell division topological specificity factor n=1 Tax=invertebrate metagenome TaxID=1711999 RepID=A0A2H9T2D1_9ZZZZ
MNIFQFFRSRKPSSSASTAKERLQIIVAHERLNRNGPNFLPAMQQDILKVVRKYIAVTHEDINIRLDSDGDCSVLEVNVQMPEQHTQAS